MAEQAFQLLTTLEAAARLGISPGRLRHLAAEGRVEPAHRLGSSLLWDPATIDAFGQEKRRPGRPPKERL